MPADPWLDRWLPIVRERAGGGRVLEIGCGSGDDTALLASAGLKVHAFDVSPEAVDKTRLRVPSAHVECRDLRDPLPAQPGELDVIVASLSLHYFPWVETQLLVGRIRTSLRGGGLLLCRLNSCEDHHFGASGHPELEPSFFLVNGEPKRFFDRLAVEALFGEGWRTLSREHCTIQKYRQPKAVWEVVLERGGC